MGVRRYFQTTRGRIVAELRRRTTASAQELADQFVVSANAIRQHLTALMREGLVVETSVRRGPTKPTYEYALTPAADALFPQQYDRLLNAVLSEVRQQFGTDGVRSVFQGIAERTVARHAPSLQAATTNDRIESVATILRQQGVEVSVERIDAETIVLSEHNCPYSQSVSKNPEVCILVHHLLAKAAPQGVRKLSSIAEGARACRFEVHAASPES